LATLLRHRTGAASRILWEVFMSHHVSVVGLYILDVLGRRSMQFRRAEMLNLSMKFG
jgi:hypothetical protein